MAITMERIDTHQTIKNLMVSGIPEKQAEAITTAINDTSNLATKEDIKDLKRDMQDLKRDIKHLEDRMEAKLGLIATDMAHLESRIVSKLILWIIGSAFGAAFSVAATIIGILPYLQR